MPILLQYLHLVFVTNVQTLQYHTLVLQKYSHMSEKRSNHTVYNVNSTRYLFPPTTERTVHAINI